MGRSSIKIQGLITNSRLTSVLRLYLASTNESKGKTLFKNLYPASLLPKCPSFFLPILLKMLFWEKKVENLVSFREKEC